MIVNLRRLAEGAGARRARRRLRNQAADNQTALDMVWLARYAAWWEEHGWQIAAPTPEQRWREVRSARR